MNNKSISTINELKALTADFRREPLRQTARRDAAVMVPIVQKEDGLHILFQVRDRSISQGGEVSFPGGRVEGDEDGSLAAIRETVEELLVEESQVNLIAPLFHSIGPGERHIYSYIGELRDYEGTFSAGEVARVFTVPLDYFLNNDPAIYPVHYKVELPEDFPYHLIPGGRDYSWTSPARNIYFYEVNGEIIWGMTAEILYETTKRLRNVVSL